MSNIYITEYTGDPEEFDPDNPEPGEVDGSVKRYTDGEELDAAAHIMELLSECIHFDVRCEVY